MTKLSVIFSTLVFSSVILFGCAQQTEQIDESNQNQLSVPRVNLPESASCKKPAPVADIWKLEPILIKNGEITDSMNKSEREKAIKAYIARKNKHYQLCLKGGKK